MKEIIFSFFNGDPKGNDRSDERKVKSQLTAVVAFYSF